MTRADMTYNDAGFVPHSHRANEWLAKMFAAIDNDLSPEQIYTIAYMAREAGFVVERK